MKDLNQRLKDTPNPDHVEPEKEMVMFIAYIDQGEGCDYTISCGKTLWKSSPVSVWWSMVTTVPIDHPLAR